MKTTRVYPRVGVDTANVPAVGQAGGVLLTETIAATGLGSELSAALAPWRMPLAVHDPAKVITDLALCLALGGDTLSDVALLRAEPDLYGLVASDPTVSRTIDALAADSPAALRAINTARAAARTRAWALAGEHAPNRATSVRSPLIIDVDATLVTSHSDKKRAAPTFKRGYGFHPLCAFVDHGAAGSGEPLALMLRAGNAGSNTAADHITVIRDALRQLPGHVPGRRRDRKVLIRTDAAGCTHDVVEWMSGQRLSYSVGFTLPAQHSRAAREDPRPRLAARLRRPRPDPRRRLGRRAHRPARPIGLATGHARHRPQRAAPPRCAAAHHRHRRPPRHRVRHQHPPRGLGTHLAGLE